MATKRQLTVEVAGQKFSLKTDADDDYVRSLARYVDSKIADARSGSRTVATQSLAILAALQIADELFQSKRRDAEFRKKVKARSQKLIEILEREAKV